MPNWGELSESQRLAAAQDYYQRRLSFPEIHRKYSISNPSTAERKIRKYRGTFIDTPCDDAPPPAMPMPQQQVDDVLASFMQYQAALQRWRNERVRDELDITVCDDKPIGVAFPADRHIGDEGTDHELQLEHARLLGGADGMHVMEGGDGVSNYINPKIRDASRSDLPPDAQYAVYAQILRMTRPVCVSHGNHDGWSSKFAGIDPLADLAGDVPTVCTADGAEIRLHVGSQMYTIYRQHKARYNSAFNLTHAVKRLWDMGRATSTWA